MPERPQSPGEEIANSVMHGGALLAAIAAVPFLVAPARPLGAAELVGHSVVAALPFAERVPRQGIALLVAGGLAYTVGIVFFALGSRVPYAHAVWHAFVTAGSVCHVFAVLGYAG